MAKQFYIILPSNSDPLNTASSFVTKLPRQINLTGEWEVGLAEVIYANTWHNVAKEQNFLQFFDLKNKVRSKMIIPPSRYQTIDELLKILNKAIAMAGSNEKSDYVSHLKFQYSEIRKYCHMVVNTKYIRSVKLSPHLLYMLGFSESQFNNIDYNIEDAEKITVADHSPDMLGGMHNFYIYCDIVEPQIVGNVFAQLLQVVNIEGKYLDIINHSYISPHYIPVLKKSFNTIDISVKTDQDQLVPFEFGKTITKLHFRKL